jgi:hypothetical protein
MTQDTEQFSRGIVLFCLLLLGNPEGSKLKYLLVFFGKTKAVSPPKKGGGVT